MDRRAFCKRQNSPVFLCVWGENSNSFIKNSLYSTEKIKSTDLNVEQSIYTYSHKQSGLVVKCYVTCFNNFEAVEWDLKFSNTSGKRSPLIEKAAVIDQTFESEKKGDFVLYHANGSNAERTDFQPIDEKMQAGENIYMTPIGGRSSDKTAFPFSISRFPGSGELW
ncbi:MAG: hypothetical protein WKG06_09840 [Segetibacter sp.]